MPENRDQFSSHNSIQFSLLLSWIEKSSLWGLPSPVKSGPLMIYKGDFSSEGREIQFLHGFSSRLAFRALIGKVVKYCSYTEQGLTSPRASQPLHSLLVTSLFNHFFNGSPLPFPLFSKPLWASVWILSPLPFVTAWDVWATYHRQHSTVP